MKLVGSECGCAGGAIWPPRLIVRAMSGWAQAVVEELVGSIAQLVGEPAPPVPDLASLGGQNQEIDFDGAR